MARREQKDALVGAVDFQPLRLYVCAPSRPEAFMTTRSSVRVRVKGSDCQHDVEPRLLLALSFATTGLVSTRPESGLMM